MMHGAKLLTYLCGNLTIKWRNSWLCAGEPEFDSLRRQEFLYLSSRCTLTVGPTQNLVVWISGALNRESM
jgi:hypothetical protein